MGKFIIRNKTDSFSFQADKKSAAVISVLAAFTLLVFLFSLSAGSAWISLFQVIKQLTGSTAEHDFVINTLRLPRTLLAFLVGAALGVSGLILQGIVRNPLASPDIIGITGGASVGAIIFLVSFAGQISISWLPLAAIAGAGAVSVIIYILSWKNGVTPIRLILIGIGIAAAMNALTTMMIVLSDIATAGRAYLWMTGSIYGANWSDVYGLLPWVIVLIPVTVFLARTVNVKELGDDVARGLGVQVQLFRFLLLFISVALAGSAVAFAGGIGFVGLIAPHIARKLIGASFAALVPAAALTGGLIVTLADVVARTAFLPSDLPAGVFTAGIGAPFFIYLLYKNRNL
ncbi:iron ABC transporter permease [Evansella sp. LMS18]|uniref:FecCD family ABC transporter permease n=1 Tax=Evansella sp. LMS18 TaxID=2924033 RepID=UPI0020D02DFA|nr:iron ABC transporter permease [Evansella sp. LMS18]UTR11069.1 iron ABC transporter permease [Evansella sp. LMS18]